MGNEQNKDNNIETGAAGASEQPKKKKMSVVFHRQNSQHNSLKTRPAGTKKQGQSVRPITKPADKAADKAAEAGAAKPAGARKPQQDQGQKASASKDGAARNAAQANPSAKPAAPQKAADGKAAQKAAEMKPSAKTADSVSAPVSASEPKTAPARQPGKEPAREGVITEKQDKADVKAAAAEPSAQKPAVKPADNKTEVKNTPAGSNKAESVEPQAATAAQDKKPEPQAQPEPEAPRFVDMNLVRAADKAASRAAANRAAGGRNRDGRQGGGSRHGQGGRDGRQGGGFRQGGQGQGGQGSRDGRQGGFRQGQGQGGQGGRDGRQGGGFRQGQGGQGAPGQKSAQGGKFGGQGSGRGSGGGFADVSMSSKPSSKNSKSGSHNRYDSKKNYGDDLRHPGVKVSNKDLLRPSKPAVKQPETPQIKEIVLPETLTVRELADKMKIQPSVIVKKLFMAGKIVTVNQEIDYETAAEIALEYDVLTEKEVKVNVIEELLKDTTVDPPESLKPRPPVVCVMGHVDHGKTSLLDAIRKTNVTTGEAGGITQAIGASVVDINGKKITFLDTPGHEAFTAMRMRGAQSTDIAVLVVAADDGVMPQTIEAINHAKAAGVEIMVAINKIDKPGANIDKVKQELTEYQIVSEEWGGKNIFVPVSAKTGEGIDDLLESILLVAEMLELRANPDRRARGLVIEARLDKGKGPVASILVQKGTLHVGDFVASGPCYGKIRAMIDDKGRRVKEVGPGYPAEIQGLTDIPLGGEILISTDTEKSARSYAEAFIVEGKKTLINDTRSRMSLEELYSQIKAGKLKEFNIVLKADVQGSVEAMRQSLEKLSNEEVVVKIIHGGVGAINESDVTLASVSNAIIIGFNVRLDPVAKSLSEEEKVDVRLYKVIYQALEDIEAALKGMLEPVFEERVVGHAVVRQTFKASGVGVIAGSYVTDGKITRNSKCRLSRSGEQLFDGPIASLKRFKDDVKEVSTGYEFGLVLEGFNDLREDDVIEAYDMVEVSRA